MKEKPTLDELFQSKKLDLPDDDFWNSFQDKVKGQTMAALSQHSKTARIRKAGMYGFVPMLVLAMVGWSMVQMHVNTSSQASLASVSSPAVLKAGGLSELSIALHEDYSADRQGALQLASLESFDSFASSSIQVAGAGENFSQHILSLSQDSGSLSQYTF